MEYRGILTGLKIRLHKNRLGELLVLDGQISPAQLNDALALSKATRRPLGRVLAENNMVSYGKIRRTLAEQFLLRLTMTAATLFISMASLGGGASQARAQGIKDVPARLAFQQVSAYAPMEQYPRIFGSSEKQSRSLSAFTKWTDMFERFDASLNTQNGYQTMNGLKSQIAFLQGKSISQMAISVNEIVNRVPYVNDSKLYGKTDYWATPVEFLRNGGDCEDFAITKYVALRALGVPEERMRLLILQDLQKNIPHAVLVVYTEKGAMVLDNQIKAATPIERISHYKPIFSINRESWWLHTKPKRDVTAVASASR